MYDVKEIQRLYAKYGSMRRVAREMKISRNTVSKYLKRVKEFRNGKKSKVIYKESANHSRIPEGTVERIQCFVQNGGEIGQRIERSEERKTICQIRENL